MHIAPTLTQRNIYSSHLSLHSQKHRDTVHVCSPYLEKLQRQMQHLHSNILPNFTPCPAVTLRLRALASRIAVFFIRHVALVRPLSQVGTLKLAADMAQLELALAPIVALKDLGAPYRELRALRPLLFREPDQILNSPELKDLSLSTVLHHLFSRAPEELLSPHVKAGWGVAKYSKWMDEHGEEEVWRVMVKPALEQYAQKVNSRGDSAFAPIYPIMIAVGHRMLERYRASQPK